MMRRRLVLAFRLLKPDGIMIITIDDNEVHHLRMLLEDASLGQHQELGIAIGITRVAVPRRLVSQ